jgi:UDP-N-acetylglucosamine--N-acetylmuramyl-(pentapeptide) pyrophosphoryl-undecaprenol N-acetylglucosamine transferase
MNDKQPLRIMVMAGGTGGHVFPALAVANELRARGVEVSWLGTRQGLEAEVVPRAGFPIDYVQVSGLRGKGVLSLLTAPLKLLLALSQSVKIIARRKPTAVLGMGGFVSGPGGLAAWMKRRPLLIHEQNARAGLTNRLLVPLARRVMEAFVGTFAAAEKVIHTGNPLRKTFLDAVPANVTAELPENTEKHALRLLVVGGSLGAAKFNEVVPQVLASLHDELRPEVWHQAGKRNIDVARSVYAAAGVEARLDAFIDDMAAAYAWADVVLCRAGAMTIAELAAAGVPSILVPFPFAVDDHQTANARYLADAQAAILLPQTQFTTERLAEILRSLTQSKLKAMAEAARKLALLDATTQVVEQCLAVAQGVNDAQGVAHG